MLVCADGYRSGDCIYDPSYLVRYKERLSPALADVMPSSKRGKFKLPVCACVVHGSFVSAVPPLLSARLLDCRVVCFFTLSPPPPSAARV